MDSLRSQEVVDSAATINRFLEETCTDDGEEPDFEARFGMASICAECIKLFVAFLKIKKNDSVNQEASISLTQSYSLLKIWADENGVTDGSLDDLLATAPGILRQGVRKLLVRISQVLTTRLPSITGMVLPTSCEESIKRLNDFVLTATDDESDVSESSTSTTSNDSLSRVLEELKTDTTCLLDFEPLLDQPLLQGSLESITRWESLNSWSPYQLYSDKINNRFPQAGPALTDRLGKANYARYLRCEKARSNSHEILDKGKGFLPADGETGPLTLENASTNFHDSGIGSSLPTTASSYADTVMSYGTESATKDTRVRMPPLPREAKEGKGFECVCCGKHVNINNNAAWKRHVYEDLQPWMCLEAECSVSDLTFPTRNDWVAHLALDHRLEPDWPSMECPLCKRAIRSGKLAVIAHLASHLEEISLGSLPVACDYDDQSESDNFEQDSDLGHMSKPAPDMPSGRTIFAPLLIQEVDTPPFHLLDPDGEIDPRINQAVSPFALGNLEFAHWNGDRSENLSMIAEPDDDQITQTDDDQIIQTDDDQITQSEYPMLPED